MFDFPNSPVLNQICNGPDGERFIWDGVKWENAELPNIYAPIDNPIFTGDPQAPTPATADSDTSIATTAFVHNVAAGYLPLAGGTMTGPLFLSTDPSVSSGAATKHYVDVLRSDVAATYLPLTGGVITGGLQVNSSFVALGNVQTNDGRLIAYRSDTNYPSVTVYMGGASVASAMFEDASGNLVFGDADGSGAPLNYRAWIDRSSGLHVQGGIVAAGQIQGGTLYTPSTLQVGGDSYLHNVYCDGSVGIMYRAYNGNWTAFGWDGSFVVAWINGTYVGELASTSWVNSNFATYGTADGRYLFKSGDTCTGSLIVNGNFTVGGRSDVNGARFMVHGSGNPAFGLDWSGHYAMGWWLDTGAGGTWWGMCDGNGNGGSGLAILETNGFFGCAGTFTVCSREVKDNIEAAPEFDSLAAIKQLKSFSYDHADTHTDFGLIAEEVEEVLPDVVRKVGGLSSVGVLPLLVHALRAINQLSERMEAASWR